MEKTKFKQQKQVANHQRAANRGLNESAGPLDSQWAECGLGQRPSNPVREGDCSSMTSKCFFSTRPREDVAILQAPRSRGQEVTHDVIIWTPPTTAWWSFF